MLLDRSLQRLLINAAIINAESIALHWTGTVHCQNMGVRHLLGERRVG